MDSHAVALLLPLYSAGEIARCAEVERALAVGDCAREGDLAAGNRQGVAVAVVGNGSEDLASCAERLIELAGAGVAGDSEVEAGIVAAASSEDDFVVTLHGQRVSDVIGAAREIGRGDSAGAESLVKRAVERAVRIVAGDHESIAAAGVVGAAH